MMDKDKEFEAYHRGYDQGRFDEYADQTGYNKAKLIKNRIEKQKNCPYCQGGKPLMEEGKPRDDYYNCVWIDKQGRLQQRTDATGAVCVDTAYGDGNDGKQLSYCPMCGRPLGGNEDG